MQLEYSYFVIVQLVYAQTFFRHLPHCLSKLFLSISYMSHKRIISKFLFVRHGHHFYHCLFLKYCDNFYHHPCSILYVVILNQNTHKTFVKKDKEQVKMGTSNRKLLYFS